MEAILTNLPALQVVIPMIAAAFCAILPGRKGYDKIAWGIMLSASWIAFAIATTLLVLSLDSAEILYEMGGWKPPIGIEYRIDTLNAFVLVIVSFMGAVMAPYALASVGDEVDEAKRPLFYSVYLLCFTGLLGITATNDIFNIYVFLEISSLSMYTLIAMGKDRRALAAAFEYLILGTIGATFLLIGIGLLYMVTGTLNITDMAARISSAPDIRPVEAAFAFITLGLGLKIAMFPMHIWLTNSYAYAPSLVSAFLASTATKVSVYVFIRLIFELFGYSFSFEEMPLTMILMTLAIAGIFVGSLSAIYQHNVKRRLAFSSIAQLGYVMLGIGIATELSLAASIVHLANHALAKGALFLAVGAVVLRVGDARLSHFRGIAKDMPFTMAAFTLSGLSLIGIPFTAGFISKWYFLQALLEKGWWPLIVVLLISSALAVIYIWRVVEEAYFGEKPEGAAKVSEAPLSMLIPMWILVIANFYFGINTEATLDIALHAARTLLGGGM